MNLLFVLGADFTYMYSIIPLGPMDGWMYG